MRKFTRLTAALLASGALATATAAPVYAQTTPRDIMIPLGGSCSANVTHIRLDGDCRLQIGGMVAATLAVVGIGSLGSVGSSSKPPVTPTTEPTTPEPTTSAEPTPTTPIDPVPTTTVPTTVPTTAPDPGDELFDPYLKSSYQLTEDISNSSLTIIHIEYLGQPTTPGLLSLDRIIDGSGGVGLDEGKTLSEGVDGYYTNGTHGEFVLTYTVDNRSVEVGRWAF